MLLSVIITSNLFSRARDVNRAFRALHLVPSQNTLGMCVRAYCIMYNIDNCLTILELSQVRRTG